MLEGSFVLRRVYDISCMRLSAIGGITLCSLMEGIMGVRVEVFAGDVNPRSLGEMIFMWPSFLAAKAGVVEFNFDCQDLTQEIEEVLKEGTLIVASLGFLSVEIEVLPCGGKKVRFSRTIVR